MAAPATVQVFNFLRDSTGVGIANLTVHCVLNYNGTTVTSTGDAVMAVQQSATTDTTGKYTFTIVPNDLISPANTTYSIIEPGRSYDIAPQSGNGASQQTTAANVIVNTPGALAAATSNVTGPLTIAGALTAQSTFDAQGVAQFDTNVRLHGPDPWYDVTHPTYGAKGDGVTDDTAAIQAAITACVNAGGGVVFFPPGTFKQTATLNVRGSNVKFLGCGRTLSIINMATTNTDGWSLTLNTGRLVNMTFEDLTLNGPNSGTSGYGLNLEGDVELVRVYIRQWWSGMRVYNSFYASAEDSFIGSNLNDGVFVDTLSTTWNSRKTRYSANGRYGFYIPNASNGIANVNFVGDLIESNISEGVRIEGNNVRTIEASFFGVHFESSVSTCDLHLGSSNAVNGAVVGTRFQDIAGAITHMQIDNSNFFYLAGNYFGQAGTSTLTLGAGALGVIDGGGNYFFTAPSINASATGITIGTPTSGTGVYAPQIRFRGAGAGKIIPPSTSFSLRNSADNQDNLIITDAGLATFVSGLKLLGYTTVQVGAGTLGYAQVTANQGTITTTVDLTGLTVTVTAGTGRRLKITGFGLFSTTVADDNMILAIMEGATQLNETQMTLRPASAIIGVIATAIITPGAGSHTYKLQAGRVSGSGTLTMSAGATFPAFILVEDIGV